MTTLRQERLENGLTLSFLDLSNRYFGDYHRVCVQVTMSCDLSEQAERAGEDLLWGQARALLGDTVSTTRTFERMGVASAEVEAVRNALIDDFLRSAAPYLARPDYPRSLVAAELNKRPRGFSYVP